MPHLVPLLLQVGPRLELEIVKVEEGLCDGRVLFHRYIQRSGEEVAAQEVSLVAAGPGGGGAVVGATARPEGSGAGLVSSFY